MINKEKILIFSFFVFLPFFLFSQSLMSEEKKLSSLCKVWGFLKYYHPEVAKGKIDWDKKLVDRIPLVLSAKDKNEISNIYIEWINSLGEVTKCKSCSTQIIPDSLKYNLDFKWISDSTLFTNTLIEQLQYIEQNRNQKKNYYVSQDRSVHTALFDNEKPYKELIFPSSEYRLLGLFRYWNIVNYFFPYKYVIGKDWDDVLSEMVPIFINAKDTMEYNLAMMELVAQINDSHASMNSKYIYRYWGKKLVPFHFKIIDDKAIVTFIRNDSLCKIDDIQYGDVIMEINKQSIAEILQEKSKYISGSNWPSKLRGFSSILFNGNANSLQIKFERNGQVISKNIHRYNYHEFNYKWEGFSEPIKIINEKIGYLNLASIPGKQTNYYIDKIQHLDAIIIDVRHGARGNLFYLANFLNNKKMPFVQFSYPLLTYPGVFIYSDVRYTGKENETNFKGSVVVLFDEHTQSHGEFTCMVLQTAPNVICIGSQTAGADGNVVYFTFPGGYKTLITGIGVYYPDGRKTQRIGIIPDIEVKPTIEGIRAKKDEVLEKAIEIASKQK